MFLPFAVFVGIRPCEWRHSMAQDSVGIVKHLLHVHGAIGTPPHVVTFMVTRQIQIDILCYYWMLVYENRMLETLFNTKACDQIELLYIGVNMCETTWTVDLMWWGAICYYRSSYLQLCFHRSSPIYGSCLIKSCMCRGLIFPSVCIMIQLQIKIWI